MSSLGTGADLTPQEADDLLHKLITESIKVQAMLSLGPDFFALMSGVVHPGADGIVRVVEREGESNAQISFKPSAAVLRKYADSRGFSADWGSSVPGVPRLSAALMFIFPNGAQIALFEVDEK